jgi:ketosteroid isomerase-like protein
VGISCVQSPTENKSQKEGTMTTEKNQAGNEAQIRQQLDNFVTAFRTKDLNLMMSLFSPKMVAFDIIPPLEYVGSDVYTKVWKETFELFQDGIDVEIRNLNIIADKNVAFK